MPQQSIVHLNRSPGESPKRQANSVANNDRVGFSEDKVNQQELSPEVRGKCFPPGRTTNIFNM